MTPVRLEPAAPRSRVKHSTTEPLCSQIQCYIVGANSAVLDEMPHIAEFHLGLLYLLKYPFRGFQSSNGLANPTEINIIYHFMHFYFIRVYTVCYMYEKRDPQRKKCNLIWKL